MRRAELIQGVKVILDNVDLRFNDESDVDYWTGLMEDCLTATLTGRHREVRIYGVVGLTVVDVWEVRFTGGVLPEGDSITEYFLPENLKKHKQRAAPKNDIEWLDRVKENFNV